MINQEAIERVITQLLSDYSKLPRPESEAEKRTEDFIRPLFEVLGWKWLSSEVTPQKRVRGGLRTTRVDYAFRKKADISPSFYMEVKRFSNDLTNKDDTRQALEYGKNGGIRWVLLTNFKRWRIFNSDFFDEIEHAELFDFNLSDCLRSQECLQWLLLLSREAGGTALEEYAKRHKKWKQSADIEEILTQQLNEARERLSKAIYDQNRELFDTTQANEDVSLDACVQHIIDRLIFCRMLEDTGADPDRRMRDVFERWERDQRIQFYRDFLCPFWAKMRKIYDSTIFDNHRVDGLSIKNDDFRSIFQAFYTDPNTKLRYRFEAIGTDVLGHAYENYLSYRIKQTAKRVGLEKMLYKRKQSGIYYTPEFLVDYLVRATLGEKLAACTTPEDTLNIRVLDPACGSGTFLVRALQEFKEWFELHAKKNGGDDGDSGPFLHAVIAQCLYGVDLDPRAVQLARLNLLLRAVGAPGGLPKPNIIEGNSLVWDDDIPKAFKLERALPLIHEQGGFDVIVGNPPWEKWKPDSQEFFEVHYPGFKDLPTQEAKSVIEGILKKRPGVRKQWEDKLREYEMFSDIFRRDYEYQSAEAGNKKVSGDLDLYKLFTERAFQLLKNDGMAGLVVPSGIYTDLGAKGLRTMLFEQCRLKGLISFENKGHTIFPAVHASYKPTLMVFEKGGKTTSFPCAFFLYTQEDLQRALENPTIMQVDFVKKSSPISWNVLEIKSLKDYEIVKRMLRYPSLGEKIEGAWNITMQSGFHMTNDSHLFQTGKLFGVPLLEGKNIYQFTHRFKEAPTPRYKVFEKDIEANIKPDKIYHKGYWMAYRLIARSTDHRTFISTIVPPGYICGNSLAIVRLDNLKALCFLTGVMNSFVADYFLRQKVSANINMFYFLETPVPRLSAGKEFEAIVRKVAQLVCTTDEFAELKKVVGIEQGLKNENEQALARAQLDAMVAKLYGITNEELAYILDKFPLIDQKQKDLVISQYRSD